MVHGPADLRSGRPFEGDVVKDGTIDRAQALHVQGRLAEAEALYREVLRAQPDSVRSLEGLGVLVFQQGRAEEAAGLFARGVGMRPGSARLHANLGEALRILRRFDESIDHLRRALALDATFAQAWNSMGLWSYDRRRFADAESACREAIRLNPRLAAGYINLGNALQALHRPVEAVEAMRIALRIEPDNVLGLANLGQVLSELGDPDLLDEAERLCRRAEALAPQLPQAPENLGNALSMQGRLEEALACYKRSLERDPRRAMPRHFIGQLLQERGRYDEAARLYEAARAVEPGEVRFLLDLAGLSAAREQHHQAAEQYRLAVTLHPECAEAHHGLGLALLDQCRLDEAEACFGQALRIDPSLALSWVALARLYSERGDFDLSCESARSALAVRPKLTEAYWRLALNLKGRLPESDVQAIEGLLDYKYLSPGVRAGLHFGLGAVMDARGLHARAALCFDIANKLQCSARAAKGQSYDPDRHSRATDRIIATFTPEFLNDRRGWGDPDPRPVFVVGLPRSGTTLVEQVLASHPQVQGAGELQDVHNIFQTLPELVGQSAGDMFDALHALTPESARKAARRYVERLDALAPARAVRVVDKMPDNIRLIGLIALLWPNAKVIVCDRDPRDVAVSCRQTDFVSIRWTNDWEHIARRFAEHRRIVAHWRQTQPIRWLDVRYEDLVGDLEGHARRLIDFLGLDWDPACLEFYSTRRVVRTASQMQVRQPIYSHSVGRWKNYESMLRPLFQSLERLGVDLDDGPGP
jgi:tetratricopeptide (TPR) repeat protein